MIISSKLSCNGMFTCSNLFPSWVLVWAVSAEQERIQCHRICSLAVITGDNAAKANEYNTLVQIVCARLPQGLLVLLDVRLGGG